MLEKPLGGHPNPLRTGRVKRLLKSQGFIALGQMLISQALVAVLRYIARKEGSEN